VFARDKEGEQNGSTTYLLYGENHFAKSDEVAAKNQKLQQKGVSEEVFCIVAILFSPTPTMPRVRNKARKETRVSQVLPSHHPLPSSIGRQ